MFKECVNITEINFSKFITSSVTSKDNIFKGCSSVTSLYLSNFITSSVKRMIFMFSGCTSLTSLDLSYFDTSSVSRMDSMFSYYSSLTSLDLSNFNFLSLTSVDTMFLDCINLEYINLYNFNLGKFKPNMFKKVPINLVICIKETINNILYNTSYNLSNSSFINTKCFIIDYSNDWKSKQKKIINNNNECIESCDKINQTEYSGKCHKNCSKGVLYDINITINKCKCELDKCSFCSQVALINDICAKSNINYFPKENDPSNLGEYLNYYKEPEGYYLDNNLYKKCYESCTLVTEKEMLKIIIV